ncbi:CheR family methyltransferase [Teichococcus aestuarii]|uniref:protein-glutamate O-methyltransferase n=1 Tax=Teichococcus aestuarii TaxID=568898 RepID=A0A2U1V5L1_9PROT|nr:protein-glutamate O-methyltransferase [Pseudoroseomonas aestuarii]PWC29207.1 chemotaxis protein CheR [Pseudoroseomonas aestuarii]
MNTESFAAIAGLVKTRSGIVLTPDKAYMLETRLAPILKQENLASLDALAMRLRDPRAEILARAVTEALTTNESSFFRDGKPFDHLRRLLPKLRAARPATHKIRIWSAACSTGQEAYSVAIILRDLGIQNAEIYGSDLSREVVERAREGSFTQFEVQRGLPVQMLVKYFKQEGSKWRVAPELRAMTRFEERNLLADHRPLGRFDVIFCRNVLIYFDPPTKGKVMNALAAQLAPDGVLYLGGAETVLGLTDRLVAVTGERGVYALAGAVSAAS